MHPSFTINAGERQRRITSLFPWTQDKPLLFGYPLTLRESVDLAALFKRVSEKKAPKSTSLFLLAVAAFALAGCAGKIESVDYSQLSGGFVEWNQDAGSSASGYSDDFVYHSAVPAGISLARSQGATEDSIASELSDLRIQTNTTVRSLRGDARATVVRTDNVTTTYEENVPLRLTVTPTQDGAWEVEVSVQECFVSQPTKCTAPAVTRVHGLYDSTNPSVTLGPLQPAEDGSGLILAGSATDGPNGSGVASIDVKTCDNVLIGHVQPNNDGTFRLVQPPILGENCFVADAHDVVGHEAISPATTYTYSLMVNPQLGVTPDGKIQVSGDATATFGSPVEVHLDLCNIAGCNNIDQLSGITLNGQTFSSGGVAPLLGDNKFSVWIRDRFGNAQNAQDLTFTYNMSIGVSSQVEPGGTITVRATPGSNTVPNFNVSVRPCNTPVETGIAAALQTDGSFLLQGITPNVGLNCEEAVVTDQYGQKTSGQTLLDYQFPLGQLQSEVRYGDIGAQLYLFGDPPANINTSTIAIHGTQPDWRSWGAEKDFMCSPLQGNVTIQGKTWRYAVVCDLPSNAGAATIRIDYEDNFGHRASVFYPAQTEFVVDVRKNPPFGQMASFFAPYVIGAALFFTSAGTGSYKMYDRENRRRRGKRGEKFLTVVGKNQQLSTFIREERQKPKVFRISEREIGLYKKLEGAWYISQGGDHLKALEEIQKLDLKKYPELEKIKTSIFDAMLRLINGRFNELAAGRNVRPLEEKRMVSLFHTLEELQKTALWQSVDKQLAYRVAERLSYLQTVRRAYTMKSRDFALRNRQLWQDKDPQTVRALERMVHMLCDWNILTTAQDFISHTKDAQRSNLQVIHDEALKRIKQLFMTGLEDAQEQALKPGRDGVIPFMREFLHGVRLSTEVESMFGEVARVHYYTRTGDYRQALSGIDTFMQAHGDESYFVLAQTNLIIGHIQSDWRELFTSRHRGKLVGEALGLAMVVNGLKGKEWWVRLPADMRHEIGLQADEIMMVGLALTTKFDVFQEAMKFGQLKRAEVIGLVNTLCAWGDYATAEACVQAYGGSEKREIEIHFENRFLRPLRKELIGVIRRDPHISLTTFLFSYRLSEHLSEEFQTIYKVEHAITEHDLSSALSIGFGYVGGEIMRFDAMKESLELTLSMAADKWGKMHKNADLRQLAASRIHTEAEYVEQMVKQPWWSRVEFQGKDSILTHIDELRVVGLAQAVDFETFQRVIGATHMKTPAAVEKLAHLLATWHDYATAEACVLSISDEALRQRARYRLYKDYVVPFGERYLHIVERPQEAAALLQGYRMSPQISNMLTSAARIMNDGRSSGRPRILGSYKAFMQNMPVGLSLTMLNEIANATVDRVSARLHEIVTVRRAQELGDPFVEEAIREVSNLQQSPYWHNAIVSPHKDSLLADIHTITLVRSARMARAQFIADHHIADSARIDETKKIIGTLCDWRDFDSAGGCIDAIGDPKLRGETQGWFDERYITPLEQQYAEVYRTDKIKAGEFTRQYNLSLPQAKRIADVGVRYEGLKRWETEDLPTYHMPIEYYANEAQQEIRRDLVARAEEMVMKRKISPDRAAQVLRRVFQIEYLTDGPMLFTILGMTDADVQRAVRSGDAMSIIQKTMFALVALRAEIEPLTNAVGEGYIKTHDSRETEALIAQHISLRMMNLLLLFRAWKKANKTKPVSSLKPVDFDAIAQLNGEDEKNIALFEGWLYELLHHTTNPVDHSLVEAYNAEHVKPILVEKRASSTTSSGISFAISWI